MSIYKHNACTTHTKVTCCNAKIESISILTFQAVRSANQISITICLHMLYSVASVCQFMYTVHARCTNVTCPNAKMSILTFQAVRSANQISITMYLHTPMCFMADEKLIEAVHAFPCL